MVVDYYSAPKKLRKTVDTGGYKLLYKGTEIPEKPITTGLNLGIEGVPLKKTKKPTVKPKVFNPMEGDQSIKSAKQKEPEKEPERPKPATTTSNLHEESPDPWNGAEEE